MQGVRDLIVDVKDFPKPGIVFKDITPILLDAGAFAEVTEALAMLAKDKNVNKIAGMESRGFLFGVPVAQRLGLGFVPLRKPGKLPRAVHSASFAKEYGEDALEMHVDACAAGDRVLIVDDLLATGGTAQAAVELIERSGARVAGLAFVIELEFLHGRDLLKNQQVDALLTY